MTPENMGTADVWERGAVLFDSHAHWDDDAFDGDREAALENALRYCRTIVNVGTNPVTSRRSIALAERYPAVYAAVGVHPSDCDKSGELPAAMDDLRGLLRHPKVRAIGEIGLDYHWDEVPRETQKIWLDAQLSLAEETGRPVIVHDREAHGDCMDAVRRHPGAIGVFHCFSGSAETASELVSLGWYVSFTGSVTFKNARKVAEAALAVPSDRLMIETDCPYLTPVPFRGQRNDSSYLRYTASFLADLRGLPLDELIRQTSDNAARFFGIAGQAV